jgi:uncharacterized protein YjbI with pentapeptide repeats
MHDNMTLQVRQMKSQPSGMTQHAVLLHLPGTVCCQKAQLSSAQLSSAQLSSAQLSSAALHVKSAGGATHSLSLKLLLEQCRTY